jgi:hypothetical protein
MTMRAICVVSLAFLVVPIAMPATAAVVIGFESGEGYTTGALSPDITTAQQGWSGGAQGGFTNNDHASATDQSVATADEAVTNAAAHSGTQSWRLSRGYNSPGQGTPYTANLPQGVANDGDSFLTDFWFKAVNSIADDSSVAIETGTAAGTDRGNYLAFIEYSSTGLQIYSFTDGSLFNQVDLFTDVDPVPWHHLSMSLTKNGYTDTVSVSLDGGSPVSYDAALNEWRQDNSFAYADSSRLKFRPRQDGDSSDGGFYFDDISYDMVPAAAVPEASSIVVWSLLALAIGGVGWFRSTQTAA